ncbi:uncharacterized protein [Spinacia oleracea]|uniref:Aminotransferase-like plant mobile domain-containing protein n=1 Tax=Spinacia oleracea TaxID=3562 RepID=A0ABM3QYY3_SPIOL|nr:uncharacterized protein LOC130463471 [Spinacia oleracea]
MGSRLPSYQPRGIPFADLMWALEHGVEESPSRQARLFYLHFITSTFLSGPTDTFDPRWIGMVEDVSTLGDYRWGDLGYATLVGQMSLSVRDSDPSRRHFVITLAGVPRLIELWAFEHLPWLAPRKGQRPLEFPAGRRWGWKKKLTVRPPPDTVLVDLTLSHLFVFVGASFDTVGVGAEAVEKTVVLLGVPLKDRAFSGIKFERKELSHE